MLKYKNLLNHHEQVYKQTSGIMQQQLHFLSTETATKVSEESDFQKEWAQAKTFESIPFEKPLTMLRKFLPGGKYAKMDSVQLMTAYKEDLGDITLLKGMLGKKDFVCTHNPLDFEKVLRNEGIWPDRPGLEVLHYYRSVIKKDFYQGTEGLLSTKDEKWGSFRSAVNPVMMQPKNVRLYMHKMSQVNREFINSFFYIFERKDKLMEEFNQLLTQDEEQKQFLLLTVDQYRQQYLSHLKSSLYTCKRSE